jgi:AcrR family transcriptional regulator
MVSRERILEAAARVYAKHGFKGATTRLIAIEAGVNEVTLFRTFGSKGALLEAVLLQHVGNEYSPTLPATPQDPRADLSRFISENLAKLESLRPLLIHTMSELDDRPEAQEFACRGRTQVHDSITTYIRQLQEMGLADPGLDVEVAALMLTGTVIADSLGRAVVPSLYPPLADVAERYTTLFLRVLGVPHQTSTRGETQPDGSPVRSTSSTTDTLSDMRS